MASPQSSETDPRPAAVWQARLALAFWPLGVLAAGAGVIAAAHALGTLPEMLLPWAVLAALALAAVAAEIDDVDLTQTRRLQLAAELGGTIALLLRPPGELALPSAARTRWRIESRPGADDAARWRVELARVQGGAPRNWTIETDRAGWRLADDDETLHRDLPAHAADRSRRKAS